MAFTSNPTPVALTAVLAVGQTKSPAVSLLKGRPVGLYTDANLSGTVLTFEASVDGTTFVPVRDGAGNAYSRTVAVSNYVALDSNVLGGAAFLKVVSGTQQSGNPTTLTIATRL